MIGLGGPVWAQQKTITIATHYTEEQMRPLTACFRRYEAENPNVKIVHQQATFRDFLQTILTSRIGGRSPDIYNVYSIWAVQLVSNGVLAEPPPDIVDFVRREYEARTVDAATVDGKIWGVPAEVSTYLLVYNKNILTGRDVSQERHKLIYSGQRFSERLCRNDDHGKLAQGHAPPGIGRQV
jgi:multiple sugar transport system substrate-binding protein